MHVVSCSHPGPEGIKKLLRSLRCNRRVRRNMMATNDQDQCTMMTPRLTLTPHEAAATDGSGTNLMHHEHAKTAAADVHGPGWIVLAPMHLPSTKSQSSCIHHERHMCVPIPTCGVMCLTREPAEDPAMGMLGSAIPMIARP